MARVKSSVVINNIVEVFNNEESNENKLVDFVSHVHLNADLSAIWIANGIKVAKKNERSAVSAIKMPAKAKPLYRRFIAFHTPTMTNLPRPNE